MLAAGCAGVQSFPRSGKWRRRSASHAANESRTWWIDSAEFLAVPRVPMGIGGIFISQGNVLNCVISYSFLTK